MRKSWTKSRCCARLITSCSCSRIHSICGSMCQGPGVLPASAPQHSAPASSSRLCACRAARWSSQVKAGRSGRNPASVGTQECPWQLKPTASTSLPSAPARCSAPRRHSQAACHHVSASCSAAPGTGVSTEYSTLWRPSGSPSSEKTSARQDVVPRSTAAMVCTANSPSQGVSVSGTQSQQAASAAWYSRRKSQRLATAVSKTFSPNSAVATVGSP